MLQEIPQQAARIPWQAHTVLDEVCCDQAKMKQIWGSIFPASRGVKHVKNLRWTKPPFRWVSTLEKD